MTQTTGPTLPPGVIADDDGVPVFGTDSGPVSYETIRLEVHPDGKPSYRESFQVHTEVDAGTILGVLSARTQLEQGLKIATLLGSILRNDDGVPLEWVPDRSETGELLPAMDDDGYVLKTDEGDPLYRDPAGDLVTDVALLNVEFEAGSSRRRFASVMDDPAKRVSLAALQGIAQWVVTRSGATPTRKPLPSTTTSQRRAGTSSGKRPARA